MKTRITAKTVSDAVDMALEKFDTTIDCIEYEIIQEPSRGFFGIGSKQAIVDVWLENEEKYEDKKVVPKAVSAAEQPENIAQKEKIYHKDEASGLEKEKAPEKEKPDIIKEAADEKKEIKLPEEALIPEKDENKKIISDPTETAKKFLNDVFEKIGIKVEIESQFHDRHIEINLKGDNMGVIIGKRGQTLDSLQYLVSLVINKGESAYVSVSIDTEGYRQRRKDTLEKLALNLAKKSKHFKKAISLEPMSSYERRIIHSALQGDRYVTTHSEGDEPFRHIVITPKQYYK